MANPSPPPSPPQRLVQPSSHRLRTRNKGNDVQYVPPSPMEKLHQAEVVRVNGMWKSAKDRLRDAENESERLRRANEHLSEENAALVRSLEVMEGHAEQYVDIQDRMRFLERALEDERRAHSDAQASCELLEARFRDLEGENEALVADYRKALEEQKTLTLRREEEIEMLTMRCKMAEERADGIDQITRAAQEQLHGQSAALWREQSKIHSARIESLEVELEKERKSTCELQSRIRDLERELAHAHEQAGSFFRSELAARAQELTDAKARITALEGELQQAKNASRDRSPIPHHPDNQSFSTHMELVRLRECLREAEARAKVAQERANDAERTSMALIRKAVHEYAGEQLKESTRAHHIASTGAADSRSEHNAHRNGATPDHDNPASCHIATMTEGIRKVDTQCSTLEIASVSGSAEGAQPRGDASAAWARRVGPHSFMHRVDADKSDSFSEENLSESSLGIDSKEPSQDRRALSQTGRRDRERRTHGNARPMAHAAELAQALQRDNARLVRLLAATTEFASIVPHISIPPQSVHFVPHGALRELLDQLEQPELVYTDRDKHSDAKALPRRPLEEAKEWVPVEALRTVAFFRHQFTPHIPTHAWETFLHRLNSAFIVACDERLRKLRQRYARRAGETRRKAEQRIPYEIVLLESKVENLRRALSQERKRNQAIYHSAHTSSHHRDAGHGEAGRREPIQDGTQQFAKRFGRGRTASSKGKMTYPPFIAKFVKRTKSMIDELVSVMDELPPGDAKQWVRVMPQCIAAFASRLTVQIDRLAESLVAGNTDNHNARSPLA